MKRLELNSIIFDHLSFKYPTSTDIFSNLNFNFSCDHPLILQGPTGGGKTTLMKLLLGLIAPTSGEYLINGQVMNELSHSQFDLFRLNMGFAFDVGGLINNRTLYENFILPIEYHNFLPRDERKKYIVSFFEHFGISEQKHIRPAFVTSGTRKLAAVIKAFVLNPQLIILNNPTLGLNSEHIEPLAELIKFHRTEMNLKYLIIATDDQNFINLIGGEVYNVTNNELYHSRINLKKVS